MAQRDAVAAFIEQAGLPPSYPRPPKTNTAVALLATTPNQWQRRPSRFPYLFSQHPPGRQLPRPLRLRQLAVVLPGALSARQLEAALRHYVVYDWVSRAQQRL